MEQSTSINKNIILKDVNRSMFFGKYYYKAVITNVASRQHKFYYEFVDYELSLRTQRWLTSSAKTLNVHALRTSNTLFLYFNDITAIEDYMNAVQWQDTAMIVYKTTSTQSNSEVIRHINPKHKFRFYFKYKRVNLQSMADFISNQALTPSPTMRRLLSKSSANNTLWLSPSIFVDGDDDRIVMLLNLTFDKCVSKVVTIEKR